MRLSGPLCSLSFVATGIKDIFATGLGCHPALGGFILGNEVTFMQSATPATLASYRGWLRSRYPGGIAGLNAAWGASFASFDAIPGQPAQAIGPVTGQGGQAAEWWDWNSFNNWRVTAMYSLMATAIHEAAMADPRCRDRPSLPMTTLKLQDDNEFSGLRRKGIDRAALVDALGWNGCDSGIASNTGLDSRGRLYAQSKVMNPPHNLANPPGGKYGGAGWPVLYSKNRYAADWLGQGAGYTLQHSLDPAKPLYDTEWHSVGTNDWRDEHMSAEYVELAVWFTVYHHLAVNVAWYVRACCDCVLCGAVTVCCVVHRLPPPGGQRRVVRSGVKCSPTHCPVPPFSGEGMPRCLAPTLLAPGWIACRMFWATVLAILLLLLLRSNIIIIPF